METLEQALRADVPLSIPILSALGKGDLQKCLRGVGGTPEPSQILALWRKLVLTSDSSQVTQHHITAVCNVLSVILNGAAASTVAGLRDFVHSEETWFNAYQCSLRALTNGKTKPAFQVLEILCRLLRGFDDAAVAKILVKAACPLVRTVLLSSPRSELKNACLVLVCLVRNTPIVSHLDLLITEFMEDHYVAWVRHLAQHNISPDQVSHIEGGEVTNLLLALVFTMADLDTRTAALKLFSAICSRNVKRDSGVSLQSIAQKVVELYLENNHVVLGDFAENVLPAILDTKEKLVHFIEPYIKLCLEDQTKMAIFLAALKVGRLQNFLSEAGTLEILQAVPWSGDGGASGVVNDYTPFQRLMTTASAEIRILAYNLLTSSPSGGTIISPKALYCVLSNVGYLHDDADAHERGEILSITRRLLRKVQTSCSYLRTRAGALTLSTSDTVELQYKSFESGFYRFLKAELQPGVSYPRHSLSLHSLRYFFDMTITPAIYKDDTELVKALCCLVLDPFEDVRMTASNLLQFLVIQVPDLVSRVVDSELLRRVGLMAAKTVRADHADGMGRLWALSHFSRQPHPCHSDGGHDRDHADLSSLLSLLGQLIFEPGDLRPGSKYPIHAYLLSISYNLRDLKARGTQLTNAESSQIFAICAAVWNRVTPQLCVDSPETSSNMDDEGTSEGPKDLLAYSWRALRDSSLVIQSLLIASQPSKVLFSSVGDLCMEQLTSLRHRGAFSTVAQTFNLCCENVRSDSDMSTRGLIEVWYTKALHQLDEQADRLTRRSAGLPAMMGALLSPAEPAFFFTAISDLMDIAHRTIVPSADDSGNNKLPQVHALNCLKEIMTNSRFSTVVVQCLSGILELAANCLSSNIWAIRNCGLMLLRACINRLDSTSMADMSFTGEHAKSKASNGHPSMIAVQLLESAADTASSPSDSANTATEHMFAALDLLGHVHSTEARAEEINSIIGRELSHSVWAVRDHAAFLLAGRLNGMSPPLAIHKLVEDIGFGRHENDVHGMLLCCRYIMRMAGGAITEGETKSILDVLFSSMSREQWRRHSPYVQAAFLDLLNDAGASALENGWTSVGSHDNLLPDLLQSSSDYNSVHWPYLLRRILMYRTYRYLLQETSFDTPDERENSLITGLIASPDALSYLLDIIEDKHCGRTQRSMAMFLINVIHGGYSKLICHPDILQQTFSCLTRTLAHVVDVPFEALQQLNGVIGLDELSSSRELGNAAMELEAFLLGMQVSSQQTVEAARKRVRRWLCRVELAAADCLDFPTRLSAARALSTYFGQSNGLQGLPLPLEATLRLLVVLYDLLNDDDEEVRLEAIQATRTVKLPRATASGNMGLCALAARELLLSEIKERFLGTQTLGQAAIMKLMNVGQDEEKITSLSVTTGAFQTSVASSLRAIFKSQNELFAAERQNLYIDDLREIDVWSSTLHRNGLRFMTQEQTESAVQWALQGLKELSQLLLIEQRTLPASIDSLHNAEDRYSRHSHPLGPTYVHEILVVFLRVVKLAQVLLVHATVKSKALLEALESARVDCLSAQVNQVLLEAIDVALAEP